MGQKLPGLSRLIASLKRDLRLDRAILFGSRARADWLMDSDVDLVIVSPDFEGKFFTDRAEEVLRLWKGNVSLHPICLTPDEFEERKQRITVVREASRKGVIVYP